MGCGASAEQDLSEHHRHAANMNAGSGIDPSTAISLSSFLTLASTAQFLD
jgi:hypothetical protein